ncbi:hypothetical protein KIH39_00040 [Telmatocola sphagniphila]|uniref:Uncharacterized protein n=1 Tax=Telmatocola sphagniphila TaxID=1123043 RepID=A0A8E6ETE5_9BACT|nr:hypothetical protein [Telmatocola sphagniphila]QVL32344.1 hypothetical protein KIH39_00040 [Telmatocola sphagniphila]
MDDDFATAWFELESEVAVRLLRTVVDFIGEHQKKVGISNPNPYLTPSEEGEFPRKRTGFGQASLTYEPASLDVIRQTWEIRVGYIENAFYMELLVTHFNRLGLEESMRQQRDRIAQNLKGE